MFDFIGIDRGRVLLYLLIGSVVVIVGLSSLRSSKTESEVIAPARAGSVETLGALSGSMVVDVSGAVKRPGVYRFRPGSRVIDAIERAGGPTDRANPAGLNRAALLVDGQQVVLPEAGPATAGTTGSGPASGTGPEPPVSLGMATLDDLDRIDGIGPVTAGKILEFRDSKGGLSSVDDLDQVEGIGPATMEKLRSAIQP